jgi:EAL domain-containing protein (putative c-di-GMP-specific phosphodiesterase class I)
VTAEGIEDLAVVPVLLRMGCTYGQGYAFGRPMPAKDIDVLLQEKAAAGCARVA